MQQDAEEQKVVLREEIILDVVENDFDETIVDQSTIDTVSEAPDLTEKIIGGHYQILSKIGQGGAGIVYKAKHLLLDKVVALKIISPEKRMDANALMRFQQEAKSVTSLNNPNIVRTYEYGVSEDGSPYLSMEYVEGKTISDLISLNGKQPVDFAIELITQAGNGLMHAHQNGVIHRDIKPENIVFYTGDDGKLVVKILDFGIAKVVNAEVGQKLTETGAVIGSPLYMSPEQCHGKELDLRSDIYSLACVLYELIAGVPPFRGESAMETLMHHIQTPAPDIPENVAPQAVNDCLQKALAKQPEKRFQTIRQFLSALKTATNKSEKYRKINDPRWWRRLDRQFASSDPKKVELLSQRIMTKFIFYLCLIAVVWILSVSYYVFEILTMARPFEFSDTKSWSHYFEAGKSARALGDYFNAEQLLLKAETSAEFEDDKDRRILVLQEMKKLYAARGLIKEVDWLDKKILKIQQSGH